jgi:hypothetical protein
MEAAAATAIAVRNGAAAIPTGYATTRVSASCAARVTTCRTTNIAAACISVAAAISIAAVTAAVSVAAATPAIPGADADEQAAREPARTVIAVGRARVRVIGVVAPRAIRWAVISRRFNDSRTDSHTDPDLGVRSRNGSERKNNKHCD